MMRSGNPALRSDTFQVPGAQPIRVGNRAQSFGGSSDVMTLQGAVNKSAILLALVVGTAFFTWTQHFSGNSGFVQMATIGGALGGFVLALITIFKKTWAPVTAPLYALVEGLFVGGFSAVMEQMYPGIVIQGVFATMGVFVALLMAYKSKLIQATENFKLGVAAATGGIFLVYLATLILGFFNIQIPMIHEGGPIGIGFSLVVVVVAALNLVMDFDFIEDGAEKGAPKYMEWFAAFGLLVTLIWLYIEMLRLLAKTQQRD